MNKKSALGIKSAGLVGLKNKYLSLSFDDKTGALRSIKNNQTGDEYLKLPEQEGNPFCICLQPDSDLYYSKSKQPPLEHAPFYPFRKDPRLCCRQVLNPREGTLKDSKIRKDANGMNLTLHTVYSPGIMVLTEVTLKENVTRWQISVTNQTEKNQQVVTIFPYFSGLCFGEDSRKNRGILPREAGGTNWAWEDAGGAYGLSYCCSIPVQGIFDPETNQGFGLFVEDKEGTNKLVQRYKGALRVTYYPVDTIPKGKTKEYPAVRVLVYNGDWRYLAKQYGLWFDKAFKKVKVPKWFTDIDRYGGGIKCWFPLPSEMEECRDKKTGKKLRLDNWADLPFEYLNPLEGDGTAECIEWAMYNSGVLRKGGIGPDGISHADGTYYLRPDLGTIGMMQEGVAKVHRLGGRVIFYIDGLVCDKGSVLSKDGRAERWQLLDENGLPWQVYKDQWHFCPAVPERQDHLAHVAARLIRETGADGIRLDSLGYYCDPCYNPAHKHPHPFIWNEGMREMLLKVHKAITSVNPEAVLLTEAPIDFYHQFCAGALCQNPTPEVPFMRAALPTYRIFMYNGGPNLAGINGMPLTNYYIPTEPVAQWRSLRYTFGSALRKGELSEITPSSDGSDPNCRLWRGDRYWLAVASSYRGINPVGFDLKTGHFGVCDIRIPNLPGRIKRAISIDAMTLQAKEVEVRYQETDKDTVALVNIAGPIGLVLLPELGCPPMVAPFDILPMKRGESRKIELTWMGSLCKKKKISAQVTVLGLSLGKSDSISVHLPCIISLKVPFNAQTGVYTFTVSGDEILGLKRFVKVF